MTQTVNSEVKVKEEIKRETLSDTSVVQYVQCEHAYIEKLKIQICDANREIKHLKTKEKIIWGVLVTQFIVSLCLFII